MSYEEHTWTTGETITADKMNNIEEGIQEAAQGADKFAPYDFVIFYDNNSYTALKGTFATVSAAMQDAETVTGLYIEVYVSGTWVTYYQSSVIMYQWNPSRSGIGINVMTHRGNSSPDYTPLFWDLNGIYFDD